MWIAYTVEPPNSGHGGDEHFVHCSEVVPSSEVEMYGQLMAGSKQFVHCRKVVLLLECPLSEVLLYIPQVDETLLTLFRNDRGSQCVQANFVIIGPFTEEAKAATSM